MILRVAWRTRAPYEWAQHVRLAGRRRHHTRRDRGDRRRRRRATGGPRSRPTLLAATDQLIDGYRIDDDTWNRLAEQLDERQLVELVFVVGTYTGLAMAFNSFGLQLDPTCKSIATTSLPEFEE